MKKPNGYGSIKKLSGNRRRPYMFVVYEDGKQKPIEYFCSHLEAEIYAADYNKQRGKQLHGHKITFAELYHRWLPFHIDKYQPSKSTLSSYRNAYNHCRALHDLHIDKIKYIHLQEVIDFVRKKGLSYSTCKKIRSTLSLMFKYAIMMDLVEKSYVNLLNLGRNKAVRPHKPFTRQKINRLWNNVDEYGVDTVLILIYTGMRVGELLELTKDNVSLRQKCIKITKSKTKAGLRTIPIHERILPLIKARMELPTKHLICNQENKSYNYSSYCTLWNKVMDLINAKHTTHDCRHTCASLLDDSEANENAKRRILGHATGDVTDTVYTHKNLKQLRKAINKIK